MPILPWPHQCCPVDIVSASCGPWLPWYEQWQPPFPGADVRVTEQCDDAGWYRGSPVGTEGKVHAHTPGGILLIEVQRGDRLVLEWAGAVKDRF